MPAEPIVVDLTALQPAIRIGKNRHDVKPTFCMPWFPDESPIFGMAAARHRRASTVERGSGESRFNLENRGRYHWGEPWLGMAREPDSQKRTNLQLRWRPPEEKHRKVEILFVEVIRALLKPFQERKKNLGLVIPAALGPGPQQELVDVLSPLFHEVQLIPRTIAIALEWCRSDEGKKVLRRCSSKAGARIGKLLVTTASADRWEAVEVPIRLERRGDHPYLCPVHDRVKPSRDLPLVGLAFFAASNRRQDIPADLLRLESIEDPRLVASGPSPHLVFEESLSVIKEWDAQKIDHSNANRPPDVLRGEDYSWDLGSVHCGTQIDGSIPEPLRALHKDNPAVHRWGANSILDGAQHAMDLLGRKLAPFFEALAPLELRVQDRNEYRDPVESWKPLIEAKEIPAGEEYRSPQPIDGLALPAGLQAKLPLFVRTKRGGDWEFLQATAVVEDPQPLQEEVQITARMRPGRGLATVDIDSVKKGQFHTHLKLDRLEPIDQPPLMEYAWPPGSAYVIRSSGLWEAAKYAIQRVAQPSRIGFAKKRDVVSARSFINSWHLAKEYDLRKVSQPLPPGIDPRFVYIGAIPSSTPIRNPVDAQALLEDFSEALANGLKSSTDRDYRRAALYTASWLYSNCPDAILKIACDELKSDLPIDGGALAVAGNCFTRPLELRIFFEELAWCIQNANGNFPPLNWLRAYRNLTRLRASALQLDIFDRKTQSIILDWYFEVFENIVDSPGSTIFGGCVYLAPHLLKRRRFDPGFLGQRTPEFLRFESLLESAASNAQSNNHHTNAKCALEFLRKTATAATLEELGQILE